jgi:transposase
MQSNLTINGVDVAMDELVVSRLDDKKVLIVANRAAPIKAWLRQLPKGSIVAMESSGRYHQLLARLAHAAGLRVYVLNARDVYFYAKALGTRGKTDRVDSGVITRYVAEHHEMLHEWQPLSAEQACIDELIRRRALLVAKRDALRQSLRGCKALKVESKKLEAAFDSIIRSIDRKLKERVKADGELCASQRRVATVIGFGPLGSTLLAVLLHRIAFANADALVAYSGWDPRPDDSGHRHGRRKLSKRGPAYLRKQWYMAGFTASHTKALKPMYQALLARGLATTEAIVILGRKLLRAAYAVWKTQGTFDLDKFLGRGALAR